MSRDNSCFTSNEFLLNKDGLRMGQAPSPLLWLDINSKDTLQAKEFSFCEDWGHSTTKDDDTTNPIDRAEVDILRILNEIGEKVTEGCIIFLKGGILCLNQDNISAFKEAIGELKRLHFHPPIVSANDFMEQIKTSMRDFITALENVFDETTHYVPTSVRYLLIVPLLLFTTTILFYYPKIPPL